MTSSEQKTIDSLYALVRDIKASNDTFKAEMAAAIDVMNNKVEKKHTPIHLEGDILQAVQKAVTHSISESLKGYGSPLTKLVGEVVTSRNNQLREIITTAFDSVISLPEFKQSIVSAFSHKVAKTIISNNDGLFDKVSNELKQDAIFKSKMQIAVSNVVEEVMRSKA